MKSTLVILALAASTLVVAAATPAGTQGPTRVEFTKFPGWSGESPGFPVARVCSGRAIHRFFDTSPVSPSGRFLAVFRLPYEDRAPQPGDAGEVVLVDLETGAERSVATSRGWELQVGANVQWGTSDHELYYNDVDPRDWSAFAVKHDPLTGATARLGGTVFMVSPDGRQLASHNLKSSRFAQAGYGVVVPEPVARRNVGPVEDDGIVLTDTATGRARRLVSLREIYSRTTPSIAVATPEQFEYYCFQVKWNPQGTRLLTTMQWTPRTGGARRRAVITLRPDGSELRTAITPEQWARGGHHVNWAPDGEQLTMNLNVDGHPGLEFVEVRPDGTGLRVLHRRGSGHPSRHSHLPFAITDAYPYEPVAAGDGSSPLRLLDLATGRERTLLQVFVSMTKGEFRVDPHPAWDRSGRYVVFNGVERGTRHVYLADLSSLLFPES